MAIKRGTESPELMKQFVQNLRSVLAVRELSNNAFAKLMSVSPTTVSYWLNGKNFPEMNRINQMSEVLNCSISELLPTDDAPKTVKIPVLGSVIAGIPISAITDILGYEEIPEHLARTGTFFGLRVKGNSMEPEMREDDILIVKKESTIENGAIGVVLFDGEDATVKKVMKSKEGITLVGYNVTVYPPHFYSNNDIMEKRIQIIGHVIQIRRNLL